jgi:hypothetical protein
VAVALILVAVELILVAVALDIFYEGVPVGVDACLPMKPSFSP